MNKFLIIALFLISFMVMVLLFIEFDLTKSKQIKETNEKEERMRILNDTVSRLLSENMDKANERIERLENQIKQDFDNKMGEMKNKMQSIDEVNKKLGDLKDEMKEIASSIKMPNQGRKEILHAALAKIYQKYSKVENICKQDGCHCTPTKEVTDQIIPILRELVEIEPNEKLNTEGFEEMIKKEYPEILEENFSCTNSRFKGKKKKNSQKKKKITKKKKSQNFFFSNSLVDWGKKKNSQENYFLVSFLL